MKNQPDGHRTSLKSNHRNTTNQIQDNSSGGMMTSASMARTTRRQSSKSLHMLSVVLPLVRL
jgi:hypothetical protein